MIKELLGIANELDRRKLYKEASAVDVVLRKIALPGEMSEEFKATLPEADEVNSIDPGEVSSESNYSGILNKIGPMPETGSSVPRITISNGPITRIPNITQSHGSKPSGLWYGCGNEWLEWIGREMPQWIGKYIYAVELNEESVLKVTTEDEFNDFESTYGLLSPYAYDGPDKIDWKQVSLDYEGIEICPYRYSKRMSSGWYYPWDVASGCIWRSSSIKSIKLIGQASDDNVRGRPSEDAPKNWNWYGL